MTGMMRSCCQSSVMARSTAASVTSRPRACLSCGDGGVARLKKLVGLNGELRNLARTGQLRAAAPVAIAAQSIDVGQNPGWPPQSRAARRADPAGSGEPRRLQLKANQQFLGERDVFGIRGGIVLAGYGLNKRRSDRGRKLPPRQKETKPVSSIQVRASSKVRVPVSVLAHPFGARCFQLLCCQRKTSLPGWRSQPEIQAPEPRSRSIPLEGLDG